MAFNSLVYFLFLAMVVPLSFALCSRVAFRNLLLLIGSYTFYGCWDWRFLSLIALSTIVDFVCGIYLQTSSKASTRKIFLSISVVTNIGILIFFKYFNFFVDSAYRLIELLGVSNVSAFRLDLILPVGISFYTFQTLSYTIDVYRRRIPGEKNLLNFAVFVAFFPQLVAGPIERAANLLPQFSKATKIRLSDLTL